MQNKHVLMREVLCFMYLKSFKQDFVFFTSEWVKSLRPTLVPGSFISAFIENWTPWEQKKSIGIIQHD